MRTSLVLGFAIASIVGLAGCGKSGSGDAAGANRAGEAQKGAEAVAFQFEPGNYRSTITVDKVDMPGMPPAAMAKMQAMMSKIGTIEYCMGPEQAARGMDAMKEHLAKGKCRWEKFEASAGTVDAVMVCQGPNGGSIRSTSHGTYTPTGAVMQAVGEMTGPGGKGMHVEETVKMERIGDCPKA